MEYAYADIQFRYIRQCCQDGTVPFSRGMLGHVTLEYVFLNGIVQCRWGPLEVRVSRAVTCWRRGLIVNVRDSGRKWPEPCDIANRTLFVWSWFVVPMNVGKVKCVAPSAINLIGVMSVTLVYIVRNYCFMSVWWNVVMTISIKNKENR